MFMSLAIFCLIVFVVGIFISAYIKCVPSAILSLIMLCLSGLCVCVATDHVDRYAYSSLTPTSILKTNNVTVAIFLDDDYQSAVSHDGWVYHATNTNILVCKTVCISETSKPVSVSYSVVLSKQ